MIEYRRRLPHVHPENATIFLTWRLYGPLPRHAATISHPTAGQAFATTDKALGRCDSGPLWLKDPRIAALVTEAIQSGESRRRFYELCAWVVMPNHVHLLILPAVSIPAITRWLKGWTARRANALLGRVGEPFWQDESYDHWVRDGKEFDRIARYIEENPVAAGLVQSAELWPWSSAVYAR
jgi:putative transposase